ncbi:MAG: helix-turn-helix domain-containing protein [Atopobiaceae bacterium]|nr:helix-turn-helix domain-containing protein [Olsenella sp.]MBR3383613.1 helix-turn-helix domain-containing protein [Atopobiaceae bacterium]
MIEVPTDCPGWERINDALLSNRGIRGIVTSAAESLGNPCCVADARFKVIALHEVGITDDPVWRETVSRGALAPKHIRAFDSEGVPERVVVGNDVQEIETDASEHPWMSVSIGLDEDRCAYFTMIECNRRVTDQDRRLFAYAARVIGCELRKASYGSEPYRGGLEHFLREAIRGTIDSPQSLEAAMLSCRYRGRPSYQIVVARLDGGRTALEGIQRFQLESALRAEFSTKADGSLVFLLSEGDVIGGSFRDVTGLAQVLDATRMRIGVSVPFDDLLQCRQHYLEALATVDLASRLGLDGRVFSFEEVSLYPFACLLAGRSEMDTFIHPRFRRLEEYDEEGNSSLVETLDCYLQSGLSVSETARKLYVHRSTATWRISRIEQIVGGQISDPDTYVMLYLSQKARRLIGAMGSTPKYGSSG